MVCAVLQIAGSKTNILIIVQKWIQQTAKNCIYKTHKQIEGIEAEQHLATALLREVNPRSEWERGKTCV